MTPFIEIDLPGFSRAKPLACKAVSLAHTIFIPLGEKRIARLCLLYWGAKPMPETKQRISSIFFKEALPKKSCPA